jgi:hypothetical protein
MKSANREIGVPGDLRSSPFLGRKASPRENGVNYIKIEIPSDRSAVFESRIFKERSALVERAGDFSSSRPDWRIAADGSAVREYSFRTGPECCHNEAMTAAIDLRFSEARSHHAYQEPHKRGWGTPKRCSMRCRDVPRGFVHVTVRGVVGRGARRKISTRGSGKCG